MAHRTTPETLTCQIHGKGRRFAPNTSFYAESEIDGRSKASTIYTDLAGGDFRESLKYGRHVAAQKCPDRRTDCGRNRNGKRAA